MRSLAVAALALVVMTPARAQESDRSKALAGELVSALNARDPAPVDGALDVGDLVARATRGLELPEDFLAGFRKGLGRSLAVGRTLVTSLGGHGEAKLLRVRREGDARVAVVRVLSGERVTYHELHLRETLGAARLVDVLSHGSGELLSEALRRLTVRAAAHANRSLLERLRGGDAALLEHEADLDRLRELSTAGQGREGLALLAALPAELQRTRPFLLARRDCAAALGEAGKAELAAADDAIARELASDPRSSLLVLGAHFRRGRHAEALQAIDRLDAAIGGDPWLEHERALVLRAAGKKAEADEAARRAIVAEPGLGPPHWLRVELAVEEKAWPRAVELLDAIEEDLQVSVPDLALIERFAPLAATAEYRAWRTRRHPARR